MSKLKYQPYRAREGPATLCQLLALAAALCVQAFALSSQVSRRSEAQDHGLLEAQNMAETLKSLHGDYAQAAQAYGGTWENTTWTLWLDETWQPCAADDAAYWVQAVPEESGDPLLGTAVITAANAAGETLATLPVAWQVLRTPQTEEEAGHA